MARAQHGTVDGDARDVRQPGCFDDFHCIGADCEDTCCAGWGVPVDRETYEKYLNLSDHQISGRPLNSLVQINPSSTSDSDYAKLCLNDATCPILQGNLCGVQQTLGEAYLPDLCSKYPRILNVIGGTVERSLDLSCPEAARLVLGDPDSMVFQERVEERLPYRAGALNFIASDPEHQLHQVRAVLIGLIKDRSVPLWQRIVSLGGAVDRIADVDTAEAAAVLKGHMSHETLPVPRPDSVFQLETMLELIVARIGSDYTSPRFLACYRDFMVGLDWTPESSMEELAARYDRSSERYFLRFVKRHEHFFENFLISYMFRTVFPYRSKLAGRKFAIDCSTESMKHSFVLLVVHYAIIRTVLIGMAALHKDNLSMQHAVMLVQSYSKAFLHSTAFEASAVEYLNKTIGDPMRKVAELILSAHDLPVTAL